MLYYPSFCEKIALWQFGRHFSTGYLSFSAMLKGMILVKKFIVFLALILLAGAGYYGYTNYWPSDEIAEMNPQNTQMVYMEGILQTQRDVFIEEQGELLLKASYVEAYTDKVFQFQPETAVYMENNRPVDIEVPVQMHNNEPYLPIAFIDSFLNIDWIYREEDQMLIMEEKRVCRLIAEVIVEEAVIRQEPTIKAPLFQVTLVPGDQLVVYETHEKWLKVRTENGVIGFIHKKNVKRYEKCRP